MLNILIIAAGGQIGCEPAEALRHKGHAAKTAYARTGCDKQLDTANKKY